MARRPSSRIGITARLVAGTLFALLLGCNTGGFTGGNKKTVDAPKVKPTPPAPAPAKPNTPLPSPEGVLGNEVEGETAPISPKPPEPPVIVIPPSLPPPPPPPPPQVQPPLVPPPPPPPVQPPVVPNPPPQQPPQPQQPQQSERGSLKFKAITFVNMEHESHATEPGSFVILKSGGRVVAAGPLYPESACRGENIDSMAYPVVNVNVALTHMVDNLQSGSGTLSVCIVQNATSPGDALQCQQVNRGNDGDRPAFWYDRQVSYTVSGNSIQVNNSAGYGEGGGGGGGGGGGFPQGGESPQGGGGLPQEGGGGAPPEGFGLYGGSENISGGLSFAHPIQAPICGSKARGYADYNSPIVLDLNGDGHYELSNVWKSKSPVAFDVEGKGQKIKTGWVLAGDALLALDTDANGTIDSGRELFGEYSLSLTPVDKWAHTPFDNGFKALAQYDDDKSGTIDAKDAVFGKLLVWVDHNADGVSQKSELRSLEEHKIKSLSLAYAKTGTPGKYLVVNMNEVRFESSFDTIDGKSHKMGDVWFAARRGNVAENEQNNAEGAQ